MGKREPLSEWQKKAVAEPVDKPKEEKLELPNNSADDFISICTNAYNDCKWYDYFSKRAWKKILESKNAIPKGIKIKPLDSKESTISQSVTKYLVAHTDRNIMRVDAKDELAVYLIRRGVIKFTESKGKDHGKKTVTITATIKINAVIPNLETYNVFKDSRDVLEHKIEGLKELIKDSRRRDEKDLMDLKKQYQEDLISTVRLIDIYLNSGKPTKKPLWKAW